jgi:hypothetical protein
LARAGALGTGRAGGSVWRWRGQGQGEGQGRRLTAGSGGRRAAVGGRVGGGPARVEQRKEGGRRRKKTRVLFKSQSTAPWPLAPWSHGTAPCPLAPYLHATAPWLLAPCILTRFLPRHGRADVSSYGTSPCGVVLCTYGAKELGVVH